MKNRMLNVSCSEIVEILATARQDSSLFIAEIDGRDVPTLSDYLSIISEILSFPVFPFGLNVDGYNDWMCDLAWLNKDGYVLAIHHFQDFLADDPAAKDMIIEIFVDSILPWWEEEVIHCVVEGKAKPFTLYLVD